MKTAPATAPASPDADAPAVAAVAEVQALPDNLGWRVFKNVTSQGAGRILIAMGRLAVAGIIIRSFGRSTFGQYSLVFGILAVAEWLVDFGVTEVFVREICRDRAKTTRLLRIVTATKSVQIAAAYVVLVAVLLALRYPGEIVRAGLVGGAGMILYAGVLVYRVSFKSDLAMERDVAAELLSVLVMVPLIWLACYYRAGLTVLVGCHFVSRGAFLAFAFLFGKNGYRPSVAGVAWPDVRWALRMSAAIGFIGLLVGVYEALDLILLSKLGSLSELAYYSGAQRLIWPVLMALAAIGATLYPVAASYWPHSRADFQKACQRGIDTVVLLAGVAICAVLAGSEFFMGLLGPDVRAGAAVLRVLAVLCFFKAISATLGPVLYVIHAQRYALQFIGVAVLVKAAVIVVLVTRFGYMGVAYGALGVEVCFAVLPCIYVFQRRSQCRVHWLVPLKVAAMIAVAAAAPRLLFSWNGLPAAVTAVAIYTPLAFLTRAVRLGDVLSLLKWRTP